MSSCTVFPRSEFTIFFDSLSKNTPLPPDKFYTLQQINTLEHVGLIPSKEAILIKNNLDDTLYAEGILSDLVVDLVEKGKLAPELKTIVSKKGLQDTISFLYTCSLEQTYSTLQPYLIQQQILKAPPSELLRRMKEAEELESKKHVIDWLFGLRIDDPTCQNLQQSLLSKPLTQEEFKENFLKLLEALSNSEEQVTEKLCLQELKNLLKGQTKESFFIVLSRYLKGFFFYQNHIKEIKENTTKQDLQFSFCLAADAIKNGPYSKELPTYYHRIYGLIKQTWQNLNQSPLKKEIVILEGNSPDEKLISQTAQKVFERANKPFSVLSLSSLKSNEKLIELLLKKIPESLVAAVSAKHQHGILDTAKKLNIPLLFLPPYTETSVWEEISNHPYKSFRIGFPTPFSSDMPEEISKEKTEIVGIPGVCQSKKCSKELKTEWGFPSNSKVVVIHAPEGNSPWPVYLSKEYKNMKDLVVVVLTDKKNKSFIHNLKTKIRPESNLPIHVFSSLSPLEREELLTLADLVIAQKQESSSSLLYETSHAKTPILIDYTPKNVWESFCNLFSFAKPALTKIHEKLLNEHHLGMMIRSKGNFKICFEELLSQDIQQPSLPRLSENLLSLAEKLAKERDQKPTMLSLFSK